MDRRKEAMATEARQLSAEERQESLPDLMYSRDVAVRILRHACWHLYFGDSRSRYSPAPVTDGAAIRTIAGAQQLVRQMALSDFYFIKEFNKVVAK